MSDLPDTTEAVAVAIYNNIMPDDDETWDFADAQDRVEAQQVAADAIAAHRKAEADAGYVTVKAELERAVDAAIDVLYNATADDSEVEVLDSLLLKTGLRWQCVAGDGVDGYDGHCGWMNTPNEIRCENCRRPRQDVDEL